MLMDLQGEGWFLSTPKGMNYFKALYDRGQDPQREEWARIACHGFEQVEALDWAHPAGV